MPGLAPSVLIPEQVADAIAAASGNWGYVGLREDPTEGLYVVAGHSVGESSYRPASPEWLRSHYLAARPELNRNQAFWHEVDADVHDSFRWNRLRGVDTPIEDLREAIGGGWRLVRHAVLVLTYARRGSRTEWAGWVRDDERFTQIEIEVFDPAGGEDRPTAFAADEGLLEQPLVTVVGTGSVGGAAAEALAAYGVRRLALVDPERLRANNFARHRVRKTEQGRYKARAVRDLLLARDPTLEVRALTENVVGDADSMRTLFRDSAMICCCADGAEARRTTAHLAFWARRPVVLGCVLNFGAYGEVLRLLPGRTGCLVCNRAGLSDGLGLEANVELERLSRLLPSPQASRHSELFSTPRRYAVDPESAGQSARAGDLHLVGGLVAKAAVAALASRAGQRRQRLPGSHCLIGLNPLSDAPPPFSYVGRAGAVRWLPTSAPRAECATCGEARGW